jgi:trehalose 6-phosphate synthase/phosphatase
VGYINGKYGKYDWIPVVYRYRSLPQEELISLYRMSDVALLTPLRDGMNLVAKEYIASRNDKKGVLILSEFTGASKDLSESLRVNPNSIEEIADAIEKALNIPENEQMLKNEAMQERLRKYNNEKWANGFVEALKNIRNVTSYKPGEKIVNDAVLSEISHNFKNASSRMIILNYDRDDNPR